jgi:ATP-dependent DNA helicase RecG
MSAFAAGEIDLLVATTVIEVGVNVPNASVMVVLDADRFGLSQLHQLRGRVGRGEHPGLCLLVSASEPDSLAMRRLEALSSTTDGFELSELDLEIRGEGDVLGSLQSGGRSSLKLLRVVRDQELIQQARLEAEKLLPELSPTLLAALDQQRLAAISES